MSNKPSTFKEKDVATPARTPMQECLDEIKRLTIQNAILTAQNQKLGEVLQGYQKTAKEPKE